LIRFLPFAAAALALASPVLAEQAAPVLVSAQDWQAIARDGKKYPLFAAEIARMRAEVDGAIRAGINVPVPKDPGGGFTHEQHKRNYRAIYGAGLLYRLTGERRYADHVRALLLAYARLYPTLGPHPAKANQTAGRLFWQSLNDSVFLVHAIQGYDAARGAMSAADRKAIEDGALRPMARFLSEGSPEVFNRIHNHATWACAAVGMTGYVLGDRDLVDKALLGLDKSGKSGFLRQLDLLFSPDGYYAEGPYYQRYALQPFVLFAAAIAANDPGRKIFAYRGGIVLKAVQAAIQLTYDGYFFPINDAMPDKSLRTEELYQAVAIAYEASRDPGLLSIAQWQGRTTLTPGGLMVARDLAAGKARPFAFASTLFRDGPEGKDGALAVLRSSAAADATVLVAKNTAQGMGHGHFDKLNWLLYDNGNAIVTDYGSARFLNIEAKDGGRYLDENDSWAQQTVAHNTLVVDETSHFAAKLKPAEAAAPSQLAYNGEGPTQWSIAEMKGAYADVGFRRALVTLKVDGLAAPLVLDVLKAEGTRKHRFDLPLHFNGQIIDAGFPLRSNVAERPVLGKAFGYQHIWVDAVGAPMAENGRLTWMTGNRFYSYRMLPPAGAQTIIAESGAGDPRFNLRREPMLIQRVDGASEAVFVGLLEPHGAYDPSAETTVASSSRIAGLERRRDGSADLVTIRFTNGKAIHVAIADQASAASPHQVTIAGKTYSWTGPIGRFGG
jgi:hypothetical protein